MRLIRLVRCRCAFLGIEEPYRFRSSADKCIAPSTGVPGEPMSNVAREARVCAGCFRYASSGLNTETRYRRRDQKSAELSVHKMVADAVALEPVSASKFPANREINRELRQIRLLGAILHADTPANSEACSENPYSTEQGIFAKEQGICRREQGI